ncbi:Ser/Thr protein phosphatase family protein [Aspergillus ibericus CBS 121593]|uniref:Ser/Thr protein phosphatase family protein n=1 Tax=Aspergillus ibericus CBS 121593 TaxID=1448316 RepID=A0A395H555_9EURO|nr:Ser/Thr protein phosphatase family protein [Aspergillus ibericus CBS 121593]RAL02629.1 Ser/Thr protein phosphatase family protein [Aspergillus ibericus CBS 121593]
MSLFSLCTAALAIPALARPGQHDRNAPIISPRQQPDANNATNWPWRPLPWGEVNFLHTTDTHGFLEGHLNEVDYGADWGDFVSFVERMRDKADEHNVDLLVVDTGDLVTGNGLSDKSKTPGEVSNKLFRNVDYDLLTTGNNDLYFDYITKQVQTDIAEYYGDHYLTTNLDVDFNDGHGPISIGKRYRYFTTKHGLRVLALGFTLQDFQRPDFITVHNASTVWNSDWFKEAISNEVDLYVLLGHTDINARCDLTGTSQYNATETPMICMKDWLRKNKPDVPLQIFGGHTHIRNFRCYDGAASGLESGRYADTVGWLALRDVASDAWNGSKTIEDVPMATRTCSSPTSSNTMVDPTTAVRLDRRYLDFNRKTFAYHAIGNESDAVDKLDTPHGQKTTGDIYNARVQLNLTGVLGCAPQSYYIFAESCNCPSSIYTMVRFALNTTVKPDGKVKPQDSPRLIIMGTGGIRYDLFKGPFSVGDAFTVSPYNDTFLYLPDVPYTAAKGVLCALKKDDYCETEDPVGPCDMPGLASSTFAYDSFSLQQPLLHHAATEIKLNPGHVTTDDFGNCSKAVNSTDCGDDTQHKPLIDKYKPPKYLQSQGNIDPKNTKTVDLVFTNHLQEKILNLTVIKDLGYKASDVDYYMPPTFTTRDFLQEYARVEWNEKAKECPVGP